MTVALPPSTTAPGVEPADPGPAAVAVSGLTVRYGRATAVDDVDLEVPAGQWLALIGPNGAGKSSLLRAVVGLVAHQGRVVLAGRPAPSGRSAARERGRLVAYVAQRPVLPDGMTVAEYVLLGRSPHLRWLAAEGSADRHVVAAVLDRLELTAFARRELVELSGGEVQRVTLARALAQEAPLLLLDEPTSALDLAHQVGVLELVDELRHERRLTVLAAMHDLGAAGRFADRLALLHQGRLVVHGRPEEVLTETTLATHYGTPVQILTDVQGGMVVVPLRHRPDAVDSS
jgi:iron complex transport system ATP-binding protein